MIANVLQGSQAQMAVTVQLATLGLTKHAWGLRSVWPVMQASTRTRQGLAHAQLALLGPVRLLAVCCLPAHAMKDTLDLTVSLAQRVTWERSRAKKARIHVRIAQHTLDRRWPVHEGRTAGAMRDTLG